MVIRETAAQERPVIGLLLEGTYPFVQGGVSSWTHQLIEGLSNEYDFKLIFIGSRAKDYGPAHYDLPSNVLSLECFYLFDDDTHPTSSSNTGVATEGFSENDASNFEDQGPSDLRPSRYSMLRAQCARLTVPVRKIFSKPSTQPTQQGVEWFQSVLSCLFDACRPMDSDQLRGFVANVQHGASALNFSLDHFFRSPMSWSLMIELYQTHFPDEPFADFYFTYRGLYRQIFRLVDIAQQIPKVDLYHTVSTGYAGFIGAILSAHHRVPLAVTEHGIYTKERRLDLYTANWLQRSHPLATVYNEEGHGFAKQLWIRFFEQLSMTCYQHATRITTLYEANRQQQIADGAAHYKTRVIPNGINLERFGFDRSSDDGPRKRVALIGRVVAIKDIKTFIKSISILKQQKVPIEALIVGPLDEQPDYVKQCEALIETLQLDDVIELTGVLGVAQLLPTLDVVVLTSISEAQPLVLLEAMAARVPVVATRVGSCASIINGTDTRHPKPCGLVVPIAAPKETALAIERLLSDEVLWRSCAATGYARVHRSYDEINMMIAYHELYHDLVKVRLEPTAQLNPISLDQTRAVSDQTRVVSTTE